MVFVLLLIKQEQHRVGLTADNDGSKSMKIQNLLTTTTQ